MKNKKKIVIDMIINIISTAMPTIALQLILLPILSGKLSGNDYGLVLTFLSLFNVLPATIGVVLNNIRLLYDNDYKKNKLVGDFQLLLVIFESINVVITLILCFFYINNSNIIDIILVISISILWLMREYYIVTFRLILNYKSIFINNIFLVVGYFIGFILYEITKYWQFIYIIGLIFSGIHIYYKSNIIKEKIVKTKFFRKVSIDCILLTIATLMSRIITFSDKLILYPLIGGTMVSVYYVSTIFSKIISMAINPINSVALSYLSKLNKKPDKLFKQTYIVGLMVCILGYIVSIIISRPILSFLYPKYVDAAMKYIFVNSATICVNVLVSIITPFVLKFFDIKWQIVINGLSAVTYILLTIVLFYCFGMMGFCIGILLSNIIKLITTTFIFIFMKGKYYDKKNNQINIEM